MSLSWDVIIAHALSLPDTELTTYYGGPAIKANDRPILSRSDDPGSFCLHLDRDKIEMLKQIDPETFWQTPHYEGYTALLVRYNSPNPQLVLDQIAASRDWTMTRRKPKPRKS